MKKLMNILAVLGLLVATLSCGGDDSSSSGGSGSGGSGGGGTVGTAPKVTSTIPAQWAQ